MKNNFLNVASLVLATALIFSACKRDRTDNLSNEDNDYATDHARLEQTFDDVQRIADEAATTGTLSNFKTTTDPSILGNCVTVTRDTISVPHTVTIDFGNSNCLCNDGRYRRGQIMVSYTGHYRDSGHVHTITFNNYFVNDNQVTGTKTITNMGHNANGKTYFSISINGAIILANNAGTRSWTSTRTRTWMAGENTPMRIDDVYEITGTATVTRANNMSFNVNITSPLIAALSCHWIKQGTVQMTPVSTSSQLTRTLDYGNGVCDALATLTIGNKTYNITLP